jgi:pilus assembly protein FimV
MTGTSSGFDSDPIDTKLDLARAYLDMGDREGARSMLEEVLAEGSQLQKDEAQRLLDSAH